VAVASTGVAILAYSASLLATLEGDSINTRFTVRGSEPVPKNLVLVGVDTPTFNALPNLQWPYPRAIHARLINRILRDHPKLIAFDVQFSEKSPYNDEVPFVDAISNANGKIVFSTTETLPNGDSRFLGELASTLIKDGLQMRIGDGQFPPDAGGVERRMLYQIGGAKAFAVQVAELASGHIVPRPSFAGKTVYNDFYGPAGSFPFISYYSALTGKSAQPYTGTPAPPPGYFHNKIVVIGAFVSTLHDTHSTPVDSAMPGPEEQANAIETVLRGLPLTGAPGWVNILLIIVMGSTVPVISLRLGPLTATAIAIALGGAFIVATQLAFNRGTVIAFVYPMLALVLSGTGSLAVQLITEAIERIRVRDLFARFVPENVVDEVLASSGGLRLGGVQREGTVMFSDLRGFTSFAESLPPAQVIDTLNRYLSEMSDAILDHGGTLVAYMGDGIMAVFGAPLPQEDHADRALAAAREMRDVRLPRFNAWLRETGLGEGFRMGIGLNSGHVMSGHVGSERRVEYTAVGDTTNTASRIEGMTKGTPYQLLLADSTRAALKTPPDDLVYHEEVEIRGRVEHLKLWSVAEVQMPTEPEPLRASPSEL
jgi:adenylate cyclase